ncbi:MAG TPA: LamG-like jellyroll fold domain-containing protein [Candidatus Solibacter sp.]|nr:LamG-like jellyroll fold domain-containing protein [Candidatus Solibacter sp.]
MVIAALCWIANYLHFEYFGFYEDDWFHYPAAWAHPTLQFWARRLYGTKFSGRQVADFFQGFFIYFGGWVRTISFMYLLSFGLYVLMAFLIYRVLRRRFPHFFCLATAALFVLTPLSTLRQSLDNQAVMGWAYVLVFTALLLRRRVPVLSYLLATTAFLTYESVALLFLGAPLLERGSLRKKRRSLAIHVAVFALLVGVVVAIRFAVGEGRVHDASAGGPFHTVLYAVLVDLWCSLQSFKLYFFGLQVAVRDASVETVLYGVLLALMTPLLFFRSRSHLAAARQRLARLRVWHPIVYGSIAGIIFLMLGYATSFYQLSVENQGASLFQVPIGGRATRYHFSASFGSSLIAAALLTMISTAPIGRIWRKVGQYVSGLILAGLLMYSLVIQSDYVKGWEAQRRFLTELIRLTPDIQPDSVVVIELKQQWMRVSRPWRESLYPLSRHGLSISIKGISRNWSEVPIYFAITEQWRDYLGLDHGNLFFKQRGIPNFVMVLQPDRFYPGRLMLLKEDQRYRLTRVDDENEFRVDHRSVLQMPPAKYEVCVSYWQKLNQTGLLEQIVYPPALPMLKGDPESPATGPCEPELSSGKEEIAQATIPERPGIDPKFTFDHVTLPFRLKGRDMVSGPRTWSAWIFPQTPLGHKGMPVITAGSYEHADFLAIRSHELFMDHWGTPQYISSQRLQEGAWNHVTVVWDGTSIRFYVNGKPSRPVAGRLFDYHLDTVTIGGNPVGGTSTDELFRGVIQDVKFFDEALGPAAVAKLACCQPPPIAK